MPDKPKKEEETSADKAWQRLKSYNVVSDIIWKSKATELEQSLRAAFDEGRKSYASDVMYIPLEELRQRYDAIVSEIHRRVGFVPDYDDAPDDDQDFSADCVYMLTNDNNRPEVVTVIGSDSDGLKTLDESSFWPTEGATHPGDVLAVLEHTDDLPHISDFVRWNDPDGGLCSREGYVTKFKMKGDHVEMWLGDGWDDVLRSSPRPNDDVYVECLLGEIEIRIKGSHRYGVLPR